MLAGSAFLLTTPGALHIATFSDAPSGAPTPEVDTTSTQQTNTQHVCGGRGVCVSQCSPGT
jgi:hypothetical protein